MDSVIVTPAGNSTRLKPRLRSGSYIARNAPKKSGNGRNCALNHKSCRNYVGRTLRNHKCAHVIGRNHPGKHFIFGKFTREVYNVVYGRMSETLGQPSPHIPGNSVKGLFNEMQLFPSSLQVSTMIQVARQVSKRNVSPQFLTMGEFSFYAREMQKARPKRKTHNKPDKCTNNCEVFLGGSCNPTTWRTDIAIPELKQHGITYYNPQVSIWAPELVAQEHDAKQSASLLLFVIDSQTRSVAGMIEVAFLVAARRCVVLVAHPYKEGQSIMDEPITHKEYVDLYNGQTSLLALVKSHGISVHTNLSSALQSTINILRNTSVNNGMTAEEQVAHKLRKLRETFDFFDKNGKGEINLEDVLYAYRRLTNKSIDMRSAYNYLSTNEDANIKRISFEQFCALVAEFSTDGCEMFTSDDWISHLLQRESTTNNNVHKDEITIEGSNNNTAMDSSSNGRYIYLGGSCSSKTGWREEVVPILQHQGINYYNPAIREGNECENNTNSILNGYSDSCVCDSNVFQWKEVMERSAVLLFYVTNDTRSLTTMILAAHYIGLRRNVVLCIQQLPHEDLHIGNEKLTKQAIKDYNRGRVYLHDLAKRKDVPVFENLLDALKCAIERYRSR